MPSINPVTIDDTRWKQRNAWLSTDPEIRLHYIDCPPPDNQIPKGTLLLIHGFPQTSYQFRHVITPLADAGYRVIVPDYRGAGDSSKPASGYTKIVMAEDLVQLVRDILGIKGKVHLVGHDIGGMIAHAYASQYPDYVASVVWGECPLPGTSAYEKTKNTMGMFHFTFQALPDLPEALVTGRERIYLKHFFERLCLNPAAISRQDLDQYTMSYSQPGALRCGFEIYRAFEKDKEENESWVRESGKCMVPAMVLSGDNSALKKLAAEMVREVYEDFEVGTVEDSGHWVAEENPEDFVRKVLKFVGKYAPA
ncbi:MAG: hypothetical protein M1836_005092 [Candelina mexicana]|nr:MAG: hypothetical protein M1836_005092 [Candelina mexicana]